MFSTIVIGLDGSDHSLKAVDYAKLLANPDAVIHVVHVRELLMGRGVGGSPVKIDDDEIVAQIKAILSKIEAAGLKTQLHIPETIRDSPASVIAETAADVHADVIVIGSRGHGPVAGLLLGSVAQRLLHFATCPVFVIPVGVGTASAPQAAAG